MTYSTSTLDEYNRRAAIDLKDGLEGRKTCRFCGAERQYVTQDIGIGLPIGFPFECKCVDALYQEHMAERGYQRTERGYVRAGGHVPCPQGYERKIALANIPERFREAKTARALGSYYFYGNSGTGKTTEACALLIQAIKQGKRAFFVGVGELVNAGFEAREELAAKMHDADVVCVDDLGKETGEWANALVFFTIDDAYARGKTLIVTSNYSPKELMARFTDASDSATADAALSRLCGMAQRVEMRGKDLRQ